MSRHSAAAAACAGSMLVAIMTHSHCPCQAAELCADVTCHAIQAINRLLLQLGALRCVANVPSIFCVHTASSRARARQTLGKNRAGRTGQQQARCSHMRVGQVVRGSPRPRGLRAGAVVCGAPGAAVLRVVVHGVGRVRPRRDLGLPPWRHLQQPRIIPTRQAGNRGKPAPLFNYGATCSNWRKPAASAAHGCQRPGCLARALALATLPCVQHLTMLPVRARAPRSARPARKPGAGTGGTRPPPVLAVCTNPSCTMRRSTVAPERRAHARRRCTAGRPRISSPGSTRACAGARLAERYERLERRQRGQREALAPVDGQARAGHLHPRLRARQQRQLGRRHLRQQHLRPAREGPHFTWGRLGLG